MKNFRVIAFDLDGTLTNPESGLIQGFVYAFKKHGIPFSRPEDLKKYIGPPLFEAWQADLGLSPEEAESLILTFREYYNIYGWWDNMLYPGIKDLLSSLKEMGKTLVVATSKPEDTAKRVLSLFEIDGYFDFIGGADGHKKRDKKDEVLRYSLSAVGVDTDSQEREECILVGDRRFDAEGASALGISSLGVLWGHGTPEELEGAGFDFLFETPTEVLSFFKGENQQ